VLAALVWFSELIQVSGQLPPTPLYDLTCFLSLSLQYDFMVDKAETDAAEEQLATGDPRGPLFFQSIVEQQYKAWMEEASLLRSVLRSRSKYLR
jgi:hypothetical protein